MANARKKPAPRHQKDGQPEFRIKLNASPSVPLALSKASAGYALHLERDELSGYSSRNSY